MEPVLDVFIVLFSVWITWKFAALYRRRGNPRALMLATVFGVIALGHAGELFIIHIFNVQTLFFLTSEVALNIVLLLALIGTAMALTGSSWRQTMPQAPAKEDEQKAA